MILKNPFLQERFSAKNFAWHLEGSFAIPAKNIFEQPR